jgi:hypothetical protein
MGMAMALPLVMDVFMGHDDVFSEPIPKRISGKSSGF